MLRMVNLIIELSVICHVLSVLGLALELSLVDYPLYKCNLISLLWKYTITMFVFVCRLIYYYIKPKN